MATIVNNQPAQVPSDRPGMGFVVGIIIAVLLIILFFAYALPAIRGSRTSTVNTPSDLNVNIRGSTSGGSGSSGGNTSGSGY